LFEGGSCMTDYVYCAVIVGLLYLHLISESVVVV
jgi:hypothetical protein